MIKSIFETAYSIWNSIISVAMTLFTTSPTEANGAVYTITYNLYNAISNIAVPIAITFFLFAILQDVIGSAPEQQVRRLFNDLLKFGILVGVLMNLWQIMGYIMQIADGVTEQFASSGTYELRMTSELRNVIAEANDTPDVEIKFKTFGEDLAEALEAWWDYITTWLLFLIASIATLVIIVSSSLSILNSSFQRIIKPLAIMPFSSITVAMASGTNEAKRITTGYLKSFFGFCISGAFMVICVKLGTALTSGLIAFDFASLTMHEKVLFISVQNMITPMVIAGLIKTTDSVLGRFF